MVWNANEQIARLPGTLVLECKALFDGVSRSESSALGLSDKCSALESMALKISISSTKIQLHWVHSEALRADVMTDGSGPDRNIFEEVMRRDRWRIIFQPLECAVHGKERSKGSICSKLTVILIRMEMSSMHQCTSDQGFCLEFVNPSHAISRRVCLVPKQTELAAAKFACEQLRSCLQLVAHTLTFFARAVLSYSLVLCSILFVSVLRNPVCVTSTHFCCTFVLRHSVSSTFSALSQDVGRVS